MRSHERYEEVKLYPFLETKYGVSLKVLEHQHEELGRLEVAVHRAWDKRDALAVALMERKGFSPDQYQVLHPGGSLGQSLIRVRDIMNTGDALPLVAESTLMSEVLLVMTAKGFGCAGVSDPSGAVTTGADSRFTDCI